VVLIYYVIEIRTLNKMKRKSTSKHSIIYIFDLSKHFPKKNVLRVLIRFCKSVNFGITLKMYLKDFVITIILNRNTFNNNYSTIS